MEFQGTHEFFDDTVELMEYNPQEAMISMIDDDRREYFEWAYQQNPSPPAEACLILHFKFKDSDFKVGRQAESYDSLRRKQSLF